MRIHVDLGQTELVDPRRMADELLDIGADRNDELVTFFAGEPTAYPTGRLADLAFIRNNTPNSAIIEPFHKDLRQT